MYQSDNEAAFNYALVNGQEDLKRNTAGSQTIPFVCLLASDHLVLLQAKTHDDPWFKSSFFTVQLYLLRLITRSDESYCLNPGTG
jgi:hypothetical protein